MYLKRKFHECDRWKPDFPIALELSLTIAGFAGGLPVGVGVGVGVRVEFAAGSSPDAAAPCPGRFYDSGFALWEVESTISYHRLAFVWSNCWPNWTGAFICYVERACLCPWWSPCKKLLNCFSTRLWILRNVKRLTNMMMNRKLMCKQIRRLETRLTCWAPGGWAHSYNHFGISLKASRI